MKKEEWEIVPFSEAIQILGGGTPKTTNLEYWGGNIPWLSVVDFNNGFRHVFDTEKKITSKGLEESSTALLNAGDIIVSARGTVGALAQLGRPMAFNQSCYGIRAKSDVACTDFIYYALRLAVEDMKRVAHGAVFSTITRQTFDLLTLRLPPLPIQHRIAEVLGALDDKIELNRQMNATLEKMAQAIFRAWFVDFEPVRAKMAGARSFPGMAQEVFEGLPGRLVLAGDREVPEGWEVKPLRDLSCYLSRGIGPAYIEDGGICVLNQKCIRDHRVDFSKARRHDAGKKAIAGRTLQVFDILVNSTGVGTLGRVSQILHLSENAIVDSHVTVVRAAPGINPCFLGATLLEREGDIEAMGEGSTGQTELSRVMLGELKIIAPSPEIQKAFGDIVGPLLQCISENEGQSRSLAAGRDILIPKLLSGEIDAETLQEAAL